MLRTLARGAFAKQKLLCTRLCASHGVFCSVRKFNELSTEQIMDMITVFERQVIISTLFSDSTLMIYLLLMQRLTELFHFVLKHTSLGLLSHISIQTIHHPGHTGLHQYFQKYLNHLLHYKHS